MEARQAWCLHGPRACTTFNLGPPIKRLQFYLALTADLSSRHSHHNAHPPLRLAPPTTRPLPAHALLSICSNRSTCRARKHPCGVPATTTTERIAPHAQCTELVRRQLVEPAAAAGGCEFGRREAGGERASSEAGGRREAGGWMSWEEREARLLEYLDLAACEGVGSAELLCAAEDAQDALK